MTKHPITGRPLPEPMTPRGELEDPGEPTASQELYDHAITAADAQHYTAEDLPWMTFGPWTIFTEETATPDSLEALIKALEILRDLASKQQGATTDDK